MPSPAERARFKRLCSGSAVAAELGTMKVSEEIEALEVMAINPISFLIVPRFLAMLVMLPALTILGDYIGVFGGLAINRHDGVLAVYARKQHLQCAIP